MKIIYLFNSSLPSFNANSLQVIHMCSEMATKNEVLLIKPNTGLDESIFNFYGVVKNFKIKEVKFFKKFPQGINFYLFSLISILISLRYKPDIFFTRNFFTAYLLNLLNKKIIFEIHTDVIYEGRIIYYLLKLSKFLNSKKIIKLIFITDSLKNHYKNCYGINNSNTLVLPSASSKKNNIIKKKSRKFNIGYFGLINKTRGEKLLFNLARIDINNTYYIVGGDAGYMQSLKIKNNLPNLKIFSYTSYQKTIKIMKKMNIVLMPYEKTEVKSSGNFGDISKFTSPMKLFDYLALGKVILSTDLKVLKEVIVEKKNCIFIKNLNPFLWKKEIQKIKNNFFKQNIISKNNRILSSNYTYKKRIEKIFFDKHCISI
jgi:glycosyltransferase involved in cell wall biosynthesis